MTTTKTTTKKGTGSKRATTKKTKKEKIAQEEPKKELKEKEEIEEKEEKKKEEKKVKYIEAIGRRKTARARVRLFTQGKKEILVNDKPYTDYFPVLSWQKNVEAPLEKLNCLGKFGFSIKVEGGGLSAQSEACRHGIARALVLLNPYFKKRLRKAGFLTRDPRMRERKKFGLKRARRAPQWQKR